MSDLDFEQPQPARAPAVDPSATDLAYGADDASAAGEQSPGSHAGNITSTFGFRRMGGTVRHHDGVDVSYPYGTPIRAHQDGVVVFAGRRNGYGLTVILDHGGSKETLYAHASSLRVRVGDQVSRGDVIAAVGATGRAYGTHLHFEIRYGGSPVDPEREYRTYHF